MPREADQSRDFFSQGPDFRGAAQFGEVDDETATEHFGACPLQKLDRGERGAAGRDQIIHHDNVVALVHCIFVNLDPVHAIFQRVILAQHLPRKLSLFAHRHKTNRQLMRHGAAENEAARLDTRHLVDAHAGIGLHQRIDRAAESARVAQERGDVAKDDAGFGIIRDRTNDCGKIHWRAPLMEVGGCTPSPALPRKGEGDSAQLCFFNTRPATASSFLNNSGSRLSGAVIIAVSSVYSMPSGEGVRSGPSMGTTRLISARALSAFSKRIRMTWSTVTWSWSGCQQS